MSKRICSNEGCERPYYARGFCKRDYLRARSSGLELLPILSDSEILAKGLTPAPGGCLVWGKYTAKNGYGQLGIHSKAMQAHRLAWTLANGPIPPGLKVLHRCDNPPCCNPDHLFLGTQADNVADMVAKNRNVYGERQNSSKLTSDQVITIRARYAQGGTTHKSLAIKYGVNPTTIGCVVRGQTWARAR